MHTLLISSHVYGFDGGLNELISVCENMGSVDIVAYTMQRESPPNVHGVYVQNRVRITTLLGQMRYIKRVYSTFRANRDIDIFFVDDFMSSFAGYIICRLLRPKFTVILSRELYCDYRMPGLGNFFLRYERKMYRVANLILCSNKERAAVMRDKYALSQEPYVFENIRKLRGEYDEAAMHEKYNDMFIGKVNIISTGGCSLTRGTARLVAAMEKLPDYQLYIFGGGPRKDYEAIEKQIAESGIRNVRLFDRVSVPELRYAISRSDIGIVEYHQNDLNNIYCASGKIYEYLFEGLPVVTTENISLKAICDTYGVGVADDSFEDGIRHVAQNLAQYRENVQRFISGISEEENNRKLSVYLVQEYEKGKA